MVSEQLFGNNVTNTPVDSPNKGSAKIQRPFSLFYIWFAANLTIGDFAIGFIPISLGQPLNLTIIALIIGNITGGSLLGVMSVIGVMARKSQMELSYGPFKRIGSSVMALLQWGNTLGWLTVNLVLASFALELIIRGTFYVILLLIVAAIVLMLAYYGHETIRRFELAMSVVLGILFLVISIKSILDLRGGIPYVSSPVIPVFAGFGITLAASFSYIMAWGPYASDYSRFVGGRKEKSHSFLYAFLGGAIASFWIELLGMLVAIYTSNAVSNPASALADFMGRYFIAGMVALFLGGIAANAINLYSNGLSFNTAINRRGKSLPILLGTAISVSLGIIGYGAFYSFYEDFLFILDYWITPWLGILIAHYFIINPKLNGSGESPKLYSGAIAYAAAILISIPFMYPPAYFQGPFGAMLNGVDISYYISFGLAVIFYTVLNRYAFSVQKEHLAPVA